MRTGDFVQLRNGDGPVMVIVSPLFLVRDGLPAAQPTDEAICCGWFDEVNHWHTAKIPTAALEAVE